MQSTLQFMMIPDSIPNRFWMCASGCYLASDFASDAQFLLHLLQRHALGLRDGHFHPESCSTIMPQKNTKT